MHLLLFYTDIKVVDQAEIDYRIENCLESVSALIKTTRFVSLM